MDHPTMTADRNTAPTPHVQLYSLSTCSHCKHVKKLFSERGIDCEIVDVDLLEGEERKRILETIRRYNPKVSFPTTVIDGEVIVGNKPRRIMEKLDSASTRS